MVGFDPLVKLGLSVRFVFNVNVVNESFGMLPVLQPKTDHSVYANRI